MRRRGVLLALALGPFGGFLRPRLSHAEEPAPAFGTEVSFELVDTEGRPVRAIDLRGRWLLVFFGYTHCPDLCPTTLGEMAEALAQLGPAAAQLRPVFVSIDPQRDTPAALRDYTKAFDDRILALTGSADQLDRAVKAFAVVSFKVPGAVENEYTFAHSAFVTLVGPEGGLVARFSADESSTGMAATLRKLIAE